MQGFIIVFSDLSEVMRLESALERSRRLAALGELAASLAHEIRNPLGALSGSFQILATSPGLSEEDVSLVDIITREIHRMERLVTDVLDYSRPRRRETDNVDVASLVRETVSTFVLDEEAQERVVAVETPQSLVQRADGGQLKQVLWNLLRNALQATEPGQRIDVLLQRENDNMTVLEVRDAGIGIDPEVARHIFDPFFSTRERGLGLGLALCQRIVEDHRGKISAKNGEDGGTVFRIELPGK
jgi:signal transduction histidine kinase